MIFIRILHRAVNIIEKRQYRIEIDSRDSWNSLCIKYTQFKHLSYQNTQKRSITVYKFYLVFEPYRDMMLEASPQIPPQFTISSYQGWVQNLRFHLTLY